MAFAPSVSYEYWKDLTLRYAEFLDEKDDEEAGNYFVLGQNVAKVRNNILKEFISFF